MLHIFLSNRPGDVRYGTSGKPVPGYQIRLVDEDGQPVTKGEIGELQVAGPTGAAYYWNNREKSRDTFLGAWTRSGDKYSENEDGYFVYSGRNDDMLKVSGIWVSPFEVESALSSHAAVLEAAVVGQADENGLIKPKAFIVLRADTPESPELTAVLQQHVKGQLAPYKYPRWIEFVEELPENRHGQDSAVQTPRQGRRRVGVMEYWSGGVVGFRIPITPILHHSTYLLHGGSKWHRRTTNSQTVPDLGGLAHGRRPVAESTRVCASAKDSHRSHAALHRHIRAARRGHH